MHNIIPITYTCFLKVKEKIHTIFLPCLLHITDTATIILATVSSDAVHCMNSSAQVTKRQDIIFVCKQRSSFTQHWNKNETEILENKSESIMSFIAPICELSN